MVATGAQPGKPNDSLSAPQPEGSEWVSLIIRATGAATYEFDAGSKSRIWSPELYDIAGLPQTINVDGDMFLQLVHDDDRGDVVQAAQHATNPEDPQAYDLEYRIVRADGAVRWVRDVSRIAPGQPGQPPRIIGVVRDIDAQKRAEQAQRVSQERFPSC
ncbi:PAS domain-containing protein [Leptospira interrogans]